MRKSQTHLNVCFGALKVLQVHFESKRVFERHTSQPEALILRSRFAYREVHAHTLFSFRRRRALQITFPLFLTKHAYVEYEFRARKRRLCVHFVMYFSLFFLGKKSYRNNCLFTLFMENITISTNLTSIEVGNRVNLQLKTDPNKSRFSIIISCIYIQVSKTSLLSDLISKMYLSQITANNSIQKKCSASVANINYFVFPNHVIRIHIFGGTF